MIIFFLYALRARKRCYIYLDWLCIVVVELPFRFKGELPVAPRWTHSKHKHLILTMSFRRKIKAKMNNANRRRAAIIQDGSNTVKLNGKEPFECGRFTEELKDEPVVLLGLELGWTFVIGANLRFRSALQRSLSLQHFEIYVWLLCRLYSHIKGLPAGMRKSGSIHRKT